METLGQGLTPDIGRIIDCEPRIHAGVLDCSAFPPSKGEGYGVVAFDLSLSNNKREIGRLPASRALVNCRRPTTSMDDNPSGCLCRHIHASEHGNRDITLAGVDSKG